MVNTDRPTGAQASGLPIVHRHAAGIDIGARFHMVAVHRDTDPEPVRRFESFTGDLHRLAAWLAQCGVTTVAMESTGVYWIPAFEILAARGFEVLLVNARDVKTVPGRKTDVSDAQWLQRLHEHGLLRGSFRPEPPVVALRAYVRQREQLVAWAATTVQHMHKALQQMNVQLHHAVSDVTGTTGMRILRAIVAGERAPAVLAQMRDPRCQVTEETLGAALTGHYQPEHVFALQQALELYDVYQEKMRACDGQIAAALRAVDPPRPDPAPRPAAAPPRPAPPTRRARRQKNAPQFELRAALDTLLGVDLTQIHGIGAPGALTLIAECGTAMQRWPTGKHFTAWLTLAPGRAISGGKVLRSKTRRSSNRAAHLLRLAAVSVGRTNTALGAFYRRLAARVGKAKAVTATARKLALLFYNTLRYGTTYVDPGADAYEQRYQQRTLSHLRRRARSLGYQLVAVTADGAGVS